MGCGDGDRSALPQVQRGRPSREPGTPPGTEIIAEGAGLMIMSNDPQAELDWLKSMAMRVMWRLECTGDEEIFFESVAG